MQLDGHHHFFQGGISGAFAQSIDGALHLRGSVSNAGERGSRCKAEVVVRMHRDLCVLYASHVLHDAANASAVLLGQAESGGVWNVHHRCACVNCRLHHAEQERQIRAAGILCIELDVFDQLLGIGDAMGDSLDALVLGNAQLAAQVRWAHANARVDPGPLGGAKGLCGAIDVLVGGTCKRAHHTTVAHQLADLLYRPKVAGTRDGKARLYCVNAQSYELLGNDELLFGVHRGARRLLAVAQRGVEDVDFSCHS